MEWLKLEKKSMKCMRKTIWEILEDVFVIINATKRQEDLWDKDQIKDNQNTKSLTYLLERENVDIKKITEEHIAVRGATSDGM